MQALAAAFLLVEDHPAASRVLAHIIGTHGRVTVARTVHDAKRLLESDRFTALVIDLFLPDGSGFDVLAAARACHPRVPALILTGSNDPEAINAAFSFGAAYLVKPATPSHIERFISEAIQGRLSIENAANAWQRQYGLCEAERDILLRAARGESRDAIAAARHASPLTVKKQAATLLSKTGDGSLQGAALRLLSEVIERHHSEEPTPEGVLRSSRDVS